MHFEYTYFEYIMNDMNAVYINITLKLLYSQYIKVTSLNLILRNIILI